MGRKKSHIVKRCEYCNLEFKAYDANEKQSFRFCSQKCYHTASRLQRTEKVCKRCGDTFLVIPSLENRVFCSDKCYFNAPSKEKLEELYLNRFLSMKSISKELNLSFLTVWKYIHKYEIPVRTEMHNSFLGGKPFNYVNGSAQGRRNSIKDRKKDTDWRKMVFERDNYTCQGCGDVGCKLEADHIKRFAEYPNLRYELSNGQSLCIPCHRKKTSEEGKKYWVNQYSI